MKKPKKTSYGKLFLSIIGIVSVCLIWACQKHFIENTEVDTGASTKPGPARVLDHKTMRFNLIEFESVIPNFADSADKALDIVADVFSSQEFKDSIYKYDFHSTNAWSLYTQQHSCQVSGYGNRILNKIDSVTGRVLGSTVYADLMADSVADIRLHILASSGSSGYGSAVPCGYIVSYDWFLQGTDAVYQYALNISHEFCHTLGYMHDSTRPAGEIDVAYTVAGIVKNILQRRKNEELINGRSFLQCLRTTGFNYMYVKPNQLAGLSPAFMTAYDTVANQYTASGQSLKYIYLKFEPGNKVKLNFYVINSSGAYYILNFEYNMTINNNVVTFTYTGSTNANSANVTKTTALRNYFTGTSFTADFMTNVSAPASSIIGSFTDVANSSSFVYGVMAD
ncbi:hypothetical protein FW774_14265 [Pedobacter sp. BS3]|uniref:hypothetical protein n=1 Tax=Pedobacter sp. BS3 TaxID=2567937 RepID=UPI0011EBFBBA|nr:hypothetical protein [Pedobacter sp. BS3]TZF82663.1 hypothetical protein FW774_14265 [Pedobacter sp. BS3]